MHTSHLPARTCLLLLVAVACLCTKAEAQAEPARLLTESLTIPPGASQKTLRFDHPVGGPYRKAEGIVTYDSVAWCPGYAKVVSGDSVYQLQRAIDLHMITITDTVKRVVSATSGVTWEATAPVIRNNTGRTLRIAVTENMLLLPKGDTSDVLTFPPYSPTDAVNVHTWQYHYLEPEKAAVLAKNSYEHNRRLLEHFGIVDSTEPFDAVEYMYKRKLFLKSHGWGMAPLELNDEVLANMLADELLVEKSGGAGSNRFMRVGYREDDGAQTFVIDTGAAVPYTARSPRDIYAAINALHSRLVIVALSPSLTEMLDYKLLDTLQLYSRYPACIVYATSYDHATWLQERTLGYGNHFYFDAPYLDGGQSLAVLLNKQPEVVSVEYNVVKKSDHSRDSDPWGHKTSHYIEVAYRVNGLDYVLTMSMSSRPHNKQLEDYMDMMKEKLAAYGHNSQGHSMMDLLYRVNDEMEHVYPDMGPDFNFSCTNHHPQ
jgi:hypothetical protein